MCDFVNKLTTTTTRDIGGCSDGWHYVQTLEVVLRSSSQVIWEYFIELPGDLLPGFGLPL